MGSGFSYSFPLQAIFELLPIKLTGKEQEDVTTAVALMADRDGQLENHLNTVVEGSPGKSEVVNAATGGVTIEFGRAFRTPPVVIACIGDTASGAILSIEHSSVTETEFQVRFYDAAGVEQNGVPFRINWIALGA